MEQKRVSWLALGTAEKMVCMLGVDWEHLKAMKMAEKFQRERRKHWESQKVELKMLGGKKDSERAEERAYWLAVVSMAQPLQQRGRMERKLEKLATQQEKLATQQEKMVLSTLPATRQNRRFLR